MNLDPIDRKIIACLQENGRISNAELAEKVSLSPTPCLRRLRKLEDSGMIQQYSVVLNHQKMGLNVSALVFVKLEKNTASNGNAFETEVCSFDQVTECCVLAGRHDYVLRVVTESLQTFENFLKEQLANVDKVADIESTIILNQVKPRIGAKL